MPSFIIRRGQSVRCKLRLKNDDGSPADMAGGCWALAPATALKVLPTFEDGPAEAWMVWTAEQTAQMTTGQKKLRLKFTQTNGQVKVFPDVYIAVQ